MESDKINRLKVVLALEWLYPWNGLAKHSRKVRSNRFTMVFLT